MQIDANGRYNITDRIAMGVASEIAIYLAGDTGGATLQLEFTGVDGAFFPLTDGLLTQNGQYRVSKGSGQILYLNVTGGTSPFFQVFVRSI